MSALHITEASTVQMPMVRHAEDPRIQGNSRVDA